MSAFVEEFWHYMEMNTDQYLTNIYSLLSPTIDLDFPNVTNEFEYESELIVGFRKVEIGFSLINQLSKFESSALDNLNTSAHSEVNARMFPDSSWGMHLAQDASIVTFKLVYFKRNTHLDLPSFFEDVYLYTSTCFKYGREEGDIYDRLGGSLISLAMCDKEIEKQLLWLSIIEFNDPPSDQSMEFHNIVLAELSERLKRGVSSAQILVDRYFVGFLVSIIASSDDVHFIIYASEESVEVGDFDEVYKQERISRNDKIYPHTQQEWLTLMAPDYEVLHLGQRAYSNLDDAINAESKAMSKLYKMFL